MFGKFIVSIIGILAGVLAQYISLRVQEPRCTANELSCELAWLSEKIGFSEEQEMAVAQIHAEIVPEIRRLRTLAEALEARVSKNEAASQGILFQLEKRRLEEACRSNSDRLVGTMLELLDDVQDSKYLIVLGR